MQGSRNNALDGLRGVAILFVLLYHYTVRFDEIYYPLYNINIFKIGGEIGVGLFFILSGYLMLLVGKKDKPKRFFIKRVFRLYPVYIISVLMTSFILYLYSSTHPSLNQILFNLTMFHEFFGVAPIDGVYWTLTLELLLYIFIFVLILTKKINYLTNLLFLWILIQFSVLYCLNNNLPSMIFTLFYYSNYFLIGMSIYGFLKENTKISSSLIVLLIYTLNFFYFHKLLPLEVMLTFIFVYIILKPNNILFSNKFIVFIGTISYPMYLIHQYIGYVLIDKLHMFIDNKLVILLLTILVIIFFSFLISKYIEKPLIKIGHKKAQGFCNE